MNNMIIIILIILIIFIFIKIDKIEKKIEEYVEKFTINLDDSDKQATQNFYSLIKGEPITLSSVNITGDLKVNGQIQIGKLVIVDNKIQFPGAGYELALGSDQWVRTNKLNAAQGPIESYVGGFAFNQLFCKDRINFMNGHYIRNGPSKIIYHNTGTNAPYSGDNVGVEMDEFTIDITYDHNVWAGFRYWSRHDPTGKLDNKFKGYVNVDGVAWNK